VKINLTSDAEKALEGIWRQLRERNPFLQKDDSRLLCALLISVKQPVLSARLLGDLLTACTTPESARLAFLRKIETVSQGMDLGSLQQLETSLRRVRIVPDRGARKAPGISATEAAGESKEEDLHG
jgi:hypothetical protein